MHTVRVRAFNLANNHTLTADVDVLEWPCQSPNVSTSVTVLDPNFPNIAGNKDGFVVTAEFSIDCMKSERFTASWELVDSSQTVVRSLANATQMISAPFALPEDSYVLSVTASMWSSYFDLTNKTVVVTECINVTTSPLVAVIDGDGFHNVSFNDTARLTAYNRTYDSSIQDTTDKSGMILLLLLLHTLLLLLHCFELLSNNRGTLAHVTTNVTTT